VDQQEGGTDPDQNRMTETTWMPINQRTCTRKPGHGTFAAQQSPRRAEFGLAFSHRQAYGEVVNLPPEPHTSPAMSGLFLRHCPPGQPAIKMNGNHTALFNSETTHGSRSARCHQP
jgi:hypothetical protein